MIRRIGTERNLTHEKIVRFGNIATDSKQLHQVMELAMDITTYLRYPINTRFPTECPTNGSILSTNRDGRIDSHDVALFDQQLPRFVTQLSYLRFGDGSTCSQLGDRSVIE